MLQRTTNSARIAIVLVSVLTALVVPTMALAQGGTTQRPIEDFLSQQGTFCPGPAPFPAPCGTFISNYAAWSDPNVTPKLLAAVDYAAKEPAAASLGTTMSGTVRERALGINETEVKVVLQTRNALTRIYAFDFAGGTCGAITAGAIQFGRNLVGDPGTVGVGDSTLEVTFINRAAPGAALPDILKYAVGPDCGGLSILDAKELKFRSSATGPLRPPALGLTLDTPGRAQITQNGLIGAALRNGFRGGLGDGFPAEHVNLQVAGR